jgi:hypothetical protein
VRFAVLLLAALTAAAQTPAPPPQPVPYSHKLHAGDLKIKCATCHTNPDPGETMTLPKPAVCGQCHAGKYDHEIKWVRVYEIPSFVFFSHRTHLTAGNTCADCHGQVAQRAQLFRETDISMGGCMNCHREKKVSIDCNFCHDPRN